MIELTEEQAENICETFCRYPWMVAELFAAGAHLGGVKMLRAGDIVKCHDEEDFEQTCEDLEADGFSTERIYPFHIRITGVPEEKG